MIDLSSSLYIKDIFKKIENPNVIFYSKAYLLKNQNIKLTYNELNTMMCNQQITNITNNSVYLYYLCAYDNKKIQQFYKQIAIPQNNKIVDFYIICNILEFEDKYRQRNQNELNTIFNSLLKMAELPKNKEDYILFYYYKALLYFLGGKLEKSKEKCNILVYQIEDKKLDDKIIEEYFKLKVKLLLYRNLIEKESQNNINEIDQLYSDLYCKIENRFECIKFQFRNFIIVNIDFTINLDEKIKFLNELYQDLKFISIEGKYELNNSSELYLSILSNLAFYYSLKYDQVNLKKILKKINKNLNIFLPQKNLGDFLMIDKNDSDVNFKEKFLFYFLCLRYIVFGIKNNVEDNCISCLYENKKNDILSNFNQYFSKFQKKNKIDQFISYYIDANLINFYNINNSNPNFKQFIYLTNNFEDSINKNDNSINRNQILIGLTSLFSIISNFSNSYINDTSISKQNEYLMKIKSTSHLIFNFLLKLSKNNELKSLFNIQLIQNIFIQSYFCYIYILLKNKDKNVYNLLIDYFKEHINKLNLKENFFNFLIYKIYGDFHVYQKNFIKAVHFYKESLRYMEEKRKNMIFDTKRAIIFFNIGYCLIKDNKTYEGRQYIEFAFEIYSKFIKFNNTEENQKNINRLKVLISKFSS